MDWTQKMNNMTITSVILAKGMAVWAGSWDRLPVMEQGYTNNNALPVMFLHCCIACKVLPVAQLLEYWTPDGESPGSSRSSAEDETPCGNSPQVVGAAAAS